MWYFDDKAPSDSWHIMIYLGPFSSKENRSLLIYHNGDRNLNGAVKKVWPNDRHNRTNRAAVGSEPPKAAVLMDWLGRR